MQELIRALLIEYRAHFMECRALSLKYRALLVDCMALFMECWCLLPGYRALSGLF